MSGYPLRSITYNLEGNMRNTFTVHCLPWEFCAPLIESFRLEASYRHYISHVNALPDASDARLRHAIAIDAQGRMIGAARLASDGRVERLAVMPHAFHEQIKTALSDILRDHADSHHCRT